MDISRVMGNLHGLMEALTKENSNRTNSQAKEFMSGQMEDSSKEHGVKEK